MITKGDHMTRRKVESAACRFSSSLNAESPSMSSQLPAQMCARRQVSLPNTLPPPTFPTCPGSPILIDSRLEGSLMAEDHLALRASEELTSHYQVTSIDTLPNDVLLEIFSSYLYESIFEKERTRTWQTLVHVCRRWRSTVFGSPRHLNLQLVCTTRTPARKTLDVWPTSPLIILCQDDYLTGGVDNIVAALECTDRACQIELINNPRSNFDIFLAAMQHPFPELTQLWLWSNDETALVSDSFLGGSAPSLESLMLCRIPFLGLPKLLLSATHLVDLDLREIPHSGYISPDTMATALSTLTTIESFTLEFQSPQSRPDRASRGLPPSTRFVYPVLVAFQFKGVSEYLNDLVAHIDAPQLHKLDITFFDDIVFNAPQFIPFISRTLTSRALEKVHIDFLAYAASADFSSGHEDPRFLDLMILCEGLDRQVSSLEKVFTSCLPPLSMLENLYIDEHLYSEADWKDNIENTLWVELLRPFIAVKNLFLPEGFAPGIAPALQELVGGRSAEVLPTLKNIFLELESSGLVQEGIGQFVAARQVAGHPIAIIPWTNYKQDMI